MQRLLVVLVEPARLREVEEQARRLRARVGQLEFLDGGGELAELVVGHAAVVVVLRFLERVSAIGRARRRRRAGEERDDDDGSHFAPANGSTR